MNKKTLNIVTLVITITVIITSAICALIFNTRFAKNTIDYFSFFAATFLIVDGFYKIWVYRNEPYFPSHLTRHIRIIIGTCVLTIHIIQYIYGV